METARLPQVKTTQTNSDNTPGTTATTGESSPRASMSTMPLYAGPPAIHLGGDTAVQANLPPHVEQLVNAPGPGEPLQSHIQSALQSSFRLDMGAVRVHTDTRASEVTDSLAARAFTYGPNIFLGSGEHPSDLALMAHEGTHVVQQQGTPVVQMSADSASADIFEQEARSASLAVQHGEQTIVTGRTNSPRIQREEKGGGFFSKLGGLVSGGKDWLLGKAAEWVKRIPGYDLLTVILGKDPITDKPVERNATNLIRGLLGLVPGGTAMFDNLQQSGALQKAFDWFNQEIAKLNLTWEAIKGLFRQFWDSLSAGDILNPSGVFDRIGQIFGAPLKRLLDFALAAGKKILELIFEGALSLAGELGQQVLRIIKKAGTAFSLIINDPIGFLKNLVQAVKGGFLNFSANILKHLKNALFEWLFGALQGAGLTLPDKFDLKGIISIILQVLGLTYARLREKLVKLIGEPAVAFIEKAFEFLKIIVTQGIAAAWEKVLEFATGLIDTVIGGIRDWAAKTIVGAAITKLVTLFNPVGAIIQGIITIYNTIKFFIERAKQIAAVAEAVFDSIINIATGNIGGAIEYVEKTMARFLPLVIGFLASFIGLGGISGEIKKIIQKIQTVVDNAINKVVNFVVDKAKALIAKVTGKDGKDKETADSKAVKDKVKKELSGKTVTNAKDAEALISGIYTKFKPEGLRGIKLIPNPDKSNVFDVLVSASITDKIAELQNPELIAKIAVSMIPFSNVTSLYIHYDGNKPFPPNQEVFVNRGGLHAEERFLKRLPELIEIINRRRNQGDLKTPPNQPVLVTLDINRTPCDLPGHNCASKLIAAATQLQSHNIKLQINAVSLYQQTGDLYHDVLTTPETLTRMLKAGIEITPLKVWGMLRDKLIAKGVKELRVSRKYEINLNEKTGDYEAAEADLAEQLKEVTKKLKEEQTLVKIPQKGEL